MCEQYSSISCEKVHEPIKLTSEAATNGTTGTGDCIDSPDAVTLDNGTGKADTRKATHAKTAHAAPSHEAGSGDAAHPVQVTCNYLLYC